MNPGYAGRSNLPDNLKKLFRSVAMSKPDKELIAEVMLYSQGFNQAKQLSKQTVPFFDQCCGQVVEAGTLRLRPSCLEERPRQLRWSQACPSDRLRWWQISAPEEVVEPQIIVQSIRETIAPKLIKSDVEIMMEHRGRVLPWRRVCARQLGEACRRPFAALPTERHLVVNEIVDDQGPPALPDPDHPPRCHDGRQFGIWKVGCVEASAARSTAGRRRRRRVATSSTPRSCQRKLCTAISTRPRASGPMVSSPAFCARSSTISVARTRKRHWIVFDGDVDPEWVENLNSVLDDNKLLTLPNGERLNLPPNVRIMFEVETLKYATLATVSRCGMVWFSEDTVTPSMMVSNYLETLRAVAFRGSG